MKKQRYILSMLMITTSLSLSSCQSPSPISEALPDNWKNNAASNEIPSEAPIQKEQSKPKPASSASVTSSSSSSTTVTSKSGAQVPPSYYLAKGTPIPHQTSDTAWVKKQNSTGYTVQLAANTSAPAVAQTLQQAPKDARMAQVQSNNNGQAGYIGVYGTYATKAEADAALAKLPTNLQSTAKVESWSSVQEKMNSTPFTTDSSSIAPPDVTDN